MNKNVAAFLLFAGMASAAFMAGKSNLFYKSETDNTDNLEYNNYEKTVTQAFSQVQFPDNVTPEQSDWDILPTIIKNTLSVKYKNANVSRVNIDAIIAGYAKGTVSINGRIETWFAERISGKWHYIWVGKGTIDCATVDMYPSFPNSLIPQCLDSKNGGMLTR